MKDTREKQITYAEGLLHGFGEAQGIVERLTNGALTLNMPEGIKSWQNRADRFKDELENERLTPPPPKGKGE